MKVVLSPIFFVLWRVKVVGRENVPTHGPAILAANHQSFCDSFFLPLVVRRKVTFLAKAEYFDSAKTAWFFRRRRSNPNSARRRLGLRASPYYGPKRCVRAGQAARPLPGRHSVQR